MKFTDHLEELRFSIFKIIITLFLGAFVGWYYYYYLLNLFLAPITNENLHIKLITVSPLDAFLVKIKLSFFYSLILTSPLQFIYIWNFISPALFSKEKKIAIISVFTGSLCFLIGVLIAYHALSFMLKFLISFSPPEVSPLWHINIYVNFVIQLMLAFGIFFELPAAVFILVRFNIVSKDTIYKMRPYIIVGAFLLAGILTPPDIISQIILAVPFIILMEISLLFASKKK